MTPNSPVASLRKRETIGWIDFLRVFAIAMVVVSHCCDNYTAMFGFNQDDFTIGAFLGSLMRPCVPLFAMMSGVLLFPVKQNMTLTAFYRKRIGRILWPLIFWSLTLPILNFLAFNYVWPDPANMSLVGPYNVDTLINRLYTWVFNFNYDTTPLWYVYMLIGIYLVLPIVSHWLDTASDRDIRTVLAIWAFTLLVPYIQYFAPDLGFRGNYDNMGIWGACSWNAFGTFYYTSGFLGYMILASYLMRRPIRCSAAKLYGITIPMFIIGFAITYLSFISLRPSANWDLIELAWYFCSINVFMMTLPIFLWVERAKIKSRPWLTSLAIMSFGVYLCHFSIVQFGYEILYPTGLPAIIRLLLNAVLTLIVSFAIVRLMMSTKLLRRFVS